MSSNASSSVADIGRKTTVTMIAVKEPDPSVDPVVVSFPSGLPRLNSDNDNDNDKNNDDPPPPLQFVWRRLRKTKNSKSKKPSIGRGGGRSVVGQDATCVYMATSDGRGYDGRRTKLCVGLHHKPTGQLTLHQAAERGTVFALQQSVKGYHSSTTTTTTTTTDDVLFSSKRMSAMDRRRALFESFGSSKKQKVLNSQQANLVNPETVVGAGEVMLEAFLKGQTQSNRKAMEDAKKGTKLDAVELAYAEARKNFLPNFDEDAKEPHLVYDARDIAGDDAWGHVSRITDACLHGSKNDDDDDLVTALTSRGQWHESVTSVLRGMAQDAPSAKYQVKCAILLNYMISFHRQKLNRNFLRGPVEEIAHRFRLPLEIAARFLELFSTAMTDDDHQGQDGFAVSKQQRDKCLVHILLLYLMMHGRQMKTGNIKPVADDVQIELGEAANLLRAAGCTVKSMGSSTTMSAALQVPLTFPPPRRSRGKT